MSFIAACVQINSGNDMLANVSRATALIKQAAHAGAQLICLPENVALMAENGEELEANSYYTKDHPALEAFQEVAKALSVQILVGSLAIKEKDSGKLVNRCFLIDSSGAILSRYDKIHLYDVDVEDGETHRESNRFMAGNKAVIARSYLARLGLTICYDLRFPYLFRHLAQQGARVITVPSAFTKHTGEAHWHTLLRARAIETSSYIIAPAQTGSHPAGRETYGHSLIIDPWGTVLADGGIDEGIITAKITPEKADKIRKTLPSLMLERSYVLDESTES